MISFFFLYSYSSSFLIPSQINSFLYRREDQNLEKEEKEATKEESKEEVEEEEWLRSVDTRLMTRASITCRSLGNGVSDPSNPSDPASTPPTIDPYDRLAQIDAYLSDLSTFHADLSLAVYRMELSQGAMESEGAKEHQARAAALRAKKRGGHGGSHSKGRGGEGGAGEMDGVVERPPKYLSPVPSVENRLSRETNKNNYERCLQLIATCTRHRSKKEEREKLLEEALQCIETARSEEEVLLEGLEGLESVAAGKSLIKHRATPLPPVFVSRSSTSITLRFDSFWTTPPTEKKDGSSGGGGSMGSRRKKTVPTVHHLRVYGKPRGAGTAVSLNNIEYGGLGDPVLVTSLGVCPEENNNQSSSTEGNDESGGGGGGGGGSGGGGGGPGSPVRAAPPTFVAGYTTGATTLTVTGLLPNESYVFACAAFDDKGEVRERFLLLLFFFFPETSH